MTANLALDFCVDDRYSSHANQVKRGDIGRLREFIERMRHREVNPRDSRQPLHAEPNSSERPKHRVHVNFSAEAYEDLRQLAVDRSITTVLREVSSSKR